MQKRQIVLIASALITLVVIIALAITVDIHTVHGNEMGVKETWSGGVIAEAFHPKTYVLIPGFSQEIFNYPTSTQVYVMNDVPGNVEVAEGREKDSYLVQSTEGQDMKISLNLMYHLDPAKVVDIHKRCRENWEEKIIRPYLMRVVKDKATTYAAIDAYSGEGLVRLQQDIETALTSAESEYAERGIVVENFVIEGIVLDPEYIGEIKKRQVAMQAELRAKQEEKTAMALAAKAKADAQADYETAVVGAERDKQVAILLAEQNAEKEVIAAEAAKQKTVLAAQGEQEAAALRAQAILALGQAEADAKKLQLGAYAVDGADNFVKIEVAKNMALAYDGVSGFVPESMKVTVFGSSFMDAVNSFAGQGKLVPKSAVNTVGSGE
jgi:regulator of protease activity HflC (stomatin/prohibitin superfamily)